MTSYLYQAPAGVAGDITRVDESNVEPANLIANGSPSTYPQAYGIPVKYATGGVAKFVTGDVAADFAGVLVREVPQISGNTNQGFDDTIPNPDQVTGVCVRGYVNVLCVVGTPARGGVVYVQSTANGGVAVGAFRADGTDSGNAVALSLTQASWASDGKDADNNAELRIAR
jgi:hypothetical protein